MRPGSIPSGGPSVASCVEAYESARANGNSAELGEFLPHRGDSLFLPVLAELIRVEMEYSWSDGNPKRLADYRQSFPELFEHRRIFADVAFEEYRQRRLAGEDLSPAEYQQQFGLDVSHWPSSGHEQSATVQRPTIRADAVRDRPFSSSGGQEFPRVGDRFESFELLAELGRGAFGRVYLARQPDLADRLVAVKISRDVYVESQALARLQHTNVMPIYSVHHVPPFHAVCMPYFPSMTLADLCRQASNRETLPQTAQALLQTVRNSATPPIPLAGTALVTSQHRSDVLSATLGQRDWVDAIVWIGARLADGLAHAHERGIIHRDLKPANILLTDEGQPLLVDFNLAEDAKSISGERAFLGGTLPYMAPEQLRAFLDGKAQSDPRGDIYSLGLVLFELLAGQYPFPEHGGNWRMAAGAMLVDRQAAPPRLRPLNPSVSPALEAIVRHCLEPDPAQRYQSARELQEDMQRQFDHRPLQYLREPSLRERWRKFLKRNPGMLSATRVGVAALMVVLVLAVVLVVREQRLAELQSQRDWHDFQHDVNPVQLVLHRPEFDMDRLAESSERVAALLDRYDARRNPEWMRLDKVRRLSSGEQQQLRREIGDLRYQLARNVILKSGQTTADRQSLLAEALELNQKAERDFTKEAVPRAIWLQRGQILDLLGRRGEASQARELAKTIPLRTARDCLLELSSHPPRAEAAALLEKAEQANPGDAYHWYLLGLACRDIGRFERAEQCLSISLGLEANQPWARAARGEVRIERLDFAGAVKDFDAALAAKPDWDEVQINRALALESRGDQASAIQDLSAVLARSPQRTELLWRRSVVRAKNRDAAGAKEDREAFLKQKPNSVRGWITRSFARRQADPNGALADLDDALKLDPESAQALQHRAQILSEFLHRPKDAVAALDSLIERHPEFVDAWAGRGVILARQGERELALRDAREALKLDRKPIIVYQVAGIFALTSAKNPDDAGEALQLLAEAFRRDPALRNLVAADPDLAAFRKRDDFRRLLEASRLVLDGK